MKKIFVIIVLTLTALTFTPAIAQDDGMRSVENERIEESLRERDLDEAPGVVEVPEIEMQGEAPSSGFVDENGNPISDEDYNKMLEDDKARAQRNRIIAGVAVVVVAGTAVAIFIKRSKAKQQ